MPHQFSVEIHNYLSSEIAEMEKTKEKAVLEKNRAREHYCKGKLKELGFMRHYLSENIDLKTRQYY